MLTPSDSARCFLGTALSEMKSTNSFFYFYFLFRPSLSPLSRLFALLIFLKRFPKRGTSVKRTHFWASDDFHDNPEGANKKIHFHGFPDNPEGRNEEKRKQPRTLLKKPPRRRKQNEQKIPFMCGCFLQLPFYPRIALFEFLFL